MMIDWGMIGLVIGLIGLAWALLCLRQLKQASSLEDIRSSANMLLICLGLYWAMIFCTCMLIYDQLPSFKPLHLAVIIPIVVGIVSTGKLYSLYGMMNEDS